MDDESNSSGPPNKANVGQYRKLVEHIQDAVVEFEFIDEEPIVRDVNSSFVETFGFQREDIRGDSLNKWIVPEWKSGEAKQIDAQTATGSITGQQVTRQTADGLKEFLHRSVPYTDDGGGIDGIAIYTDLTEIIQQRKQLQVMNRVLRHNLRNRVNVIRGNTTQLLDSSDEQVAKEGSVAKNIDVAASKLESLGEDAQKINEVLSEGSSVNQADIVSLLRQTIRDVQDQYPSAEIDADLPASGFTKADNRLRFAFESIIENAVEHNPASRPRVQVRVEKARSNDWVDICIDDNGPLIPDNERKIIDEDAEITPVQHGTGLGLWLAKWTVESYGGDISIRESDLGGNSVRFRLLQGSEK